MHSECVHDMHTHRAMCAGRGALTQLEQPAFPVRVEEGVGEVAAVVLGDGEGLALDAVEEVLQGAGRKDLGVRPGGGGLGSPSCPADPSLLAAHPGPRRAHWSPFCSGPGGAQPLALPPWELSGTEAA